MRLKSKIIWNNYGANIDLFSPKEMIDHMNRDMVVTRAELNLSNVNVSDAKVAAQLAAQMMAQAKGEK